MSTRHNIALFLTRNVPLEMWDSIGTLERELTVYDRLTEKGYSFDLISWGKSLKERELIQSYAGINVSCNNFRLSGRMYEKTMGFLKASVFRRCSLIKTNQFQGADLALRIARKFGKKLIVRMGYLPSENHAINFGADHPNTTKQLESESMILKAADHIVVTTSRVRDKLIETHQLDPNAISIIPNFVDTDKFAPGRNEPPRDFTVTYIGRFHGEKNIANLVKAAHQLNVNLNLIGEGGLRGELESLAQGNDRIKFVGKVPNHELPMWLNRSTAYVLPSLLEGHPKTLIEAMACGLPVIGSNVQGNNEVIRHGVNGLLCPTTTEGIRDAIESLMSNIDLQARLGQDARRFVVESYSINTISGLEEKLYGKLLEI